MNTLANPVRMDGRVRPGHDGKRGEASSRPSVLDGYSLRQG